QQALRGAMDQTAASPDARMNEALRQALGSGVMLDALPVGICCCDRDGLIWAFNRRATELWGRSPVRGDPLHRFTGAFKLFLPDGRPLPHDAAPMAVVLRDGVPVRDRRVVIERADGTRITTLSNVEPLFAADGTRVGAVNCFRDITELALAEDRLRDDEQR